MNNIFIHIAYYIIYYIYISAVAERFVFVFGRLPASCPLALHTAVEVGMAFISKYV